MTPRAMLITALMLGAFVSAAGAYGLFYCLARHLGKSIFMSASMVSYAVLLATCIATVTLTPLHIGWKLFIVASCAAYTVIPPLTWRYLTQLHGRENPSHDRGPAKHPNRTMPGLFRGA